jgi:hypothetical protein
VHAVDEMRDLAHRLGYRLALLGGEHGRELLGVPLDEIGRRPENPGPLLHVGLRPLGERALRGLHRAVHVLGGPGRDGVHHLFGGRVHHLELGARRRGLLLASDQHLWHWLPFRYPVRVAFSKFSM